MSKPAFNRTHACLHGALALAIVATLPAAIAAEHGDATRREAQLRAAMERDAGIPAAKVDAFFAAQDQATQRVGRIRQSLDKNAFGGSWLERRADGRIDVVVGVADGRTHALDGAIQRKVQYGYDALQSRKAQLDAFFQSHADQKKWKLVQSWYVDVPGNRVVVEVAPNASPQVAYDFLASARVPVAMAQVRRAPASARMAATGVTIKRGYAFFTGGSRCSVGFPVIQTDTTDSKKTARGYLTAAHCGSSGATATLGSSTGKVKQVNTANDIELVLQDTDDDLLENDNMYQSYGGGDAPIGSFVCKSGSSTGFTCGSVLAQGVSANYMGLPYTVYNLTTVAMTVQPGDSGGGVSLGRAPVGIVSGLMQKPNSTMITAYYAPLKSAWSAFGVREAKTYVATLDPTKTTISDKAAVEATVTVAGRDDWQMPTALVTVELTHPAVGELVLTLVSPSGKTYVVYNQVASATANLKKTFNTAIAFENPNGDWKLKVEDKKAGNDGTLVNFTLSF